MKSGRLRDVITIQRKQITVGDMGQQATAWRAHAQVFAQVKSEMGAEAPVRRTEGEYEEPITFWIRYLEDVNSADRILYKSKQYTIDGLRPLSLSRYNDALEIKAVHRG